MPAGRAAKRAGGAIRTEMKTVSAMIRITCADLHGGGAVCPDCAGLNAYAMRRLELCRFGDDKPTCFNCPVHCYKPEMRERIRGVMRHAGPKMMFRHPWLALVHLWKGRKASPPRPVN